MLELYVCVFTQMVESGYIEEPYTVHASPDLCHICNFTL